KTVLLCVIWVLSALIVCACQKTGTEKPQAPATPPVEKPSVRKPVEPSPASLSTIEEIKRRGELRVGMQVGYTPFEMPGKDGTVEGFDIDTAQLIARSLMVNLRIVGEKWQDLIPSLIAGKTDVIMSGMIVTPKRNERAMFTIPIVESGRMFVVHLSNADRFRKLADLDTSGTFVVSIPGGLGDVQPRTVFPKASYREFPTRKQALDEVLEKRAHAFIDGEFSIRLAAATHAESLAAGFKPLTYESIAWAVRPGDTHWLNWLNNFVRVIRKDGTLDKLEKKWFRDYFLDIHSAKKTIR
ncbi:MAG: transporter substrate-binding domain-containing protein, partial [Pseudomonadota bacterium]